MAMFTLQWRLVHDVALVLLSKPEWTEGDMSLALHIQYESRVTQWQILNRIHCVRALFVTCTFVAGTKMQWNETRVWNKQ